MNIPVKAYGNISKVQPEHVFCAFVSYNKLLKVFCLTFGVHITFNLFVCINALQKM